MNLAYIWKAKWEAKEKTRENATRRTTSKCVFKELAEVISSIMAKFYVEKIIPLQMFSSDIWHLALLE